MILITENEFGELWRLSTKVATPSGSGETPDLIFAAKKAA